MEYQCYVETRPAHHALAIRFVSSLQELPKNIGESYEKIGAYICKNGVKVVGAPYAAYRNMDMENLDSEAGIIIDQRAEGLNEIKYVSIPATKAVVTIHTGPYTMLKDAYTAISEYCKKQNVIPAGTVYEYYLNDPQTVRPEELKTEVVFIVK